MTEKLPHLSDDHHFAIANVAVRSSQLEYHIERTLTKAFEKQLRTAEFLLKNLGADRIVGLLGAVLTDAIPIEKPQIENLVQSIKDIRLERNEILHWTWGPGEKEGTARNTMIRPFREIRHSLKTAPQIQQIADEMVEISYALMDWYAFLHGQPRQP